MDLNRFLIVLGRSDARRHAPVPLVLGRELGRFLNGPLAAGQRGKVFHADPGYVRRIFYARAKECGVPRELATPRVLRNTRAVEMLRSGVPLAAVSDMLGQSSHGPPRPCTSSIPGGDVTCLVRRLATSDKPLRTSARNTFAGHVGTLRSDGLMAEVAMGHGLGRTAVRPDHHREHESPWDLEPEAPVMASIKAPLVNVRRLGGRPAEQRPQRAGGPWSRACAPPRF